MRWNMTVIAKTHDVRASTIIVRCTSPRDDVPTTSELTKRVAPTAHMIKVVLLRPFQKNDEVVIIKDETKR